jgi:hypothetical protein
MRARLPEYNLGQIFLETGKWKWIAWLEDGQLWIDFADFSSP